MKKEVKRGYPKRDKIIELRRNGYSYREICRKLHVSKRAITKFTRNIRLSRKGKRRYLNKNGTTKIILKQNKKLTLRKTRVIGNLLFDGALYIAKEYHYGVMYINSSLYLVKEFCDDVKKIYGLRPSLYKLQSKYSKFYRARQNSIKIYLDLARYIKSYSTSSKLSKIPKEVMNGSKQIQLEFMRTFWNNEGCVNWRGGLSGNSNSLIVIKQLAELHKKFGFTLSVHKSDEFRKSPSYLLRLYKTKDNLTKFYKYKLFTEAVVTKGYNKGKRKIDVLKQFI